MKPKHKELVDNYFKYECNKSRALKETGYKHMKVFNHPEVVKEIQRRQNISTTKVMGREEKVIGFWLDIVEDGNRPISARVRASENLAKHYGMFTEKIEMKGEVDLIQRIYAARKRVFKEE